MATQPRHRSSTSVRSNARFEYGTLSILPGVGDDSLASSIQSTMDPKERHICGGMEGIKRGRVAPESKLLRRENSRNPANYLNSRPLG